MSAALLLKPQPLLHGRMFLAPKLQTPTQALTRPITIQFFGFPTQTLAKPVRNAPCAEATRRDRVALGTCRPRHHWVRRVPDRWGADVVTIALNAASRASGEAGDSRMSFRRGRPQCATASARSPASVLLQFVPKRACGCSSCDAGCRGISRSEASALPAYKMAAYGIR